LTVPALLLGRRVLAVDDLTRPWAVAVATSRVTLEGGLAVVHQAGLPTAAGRAGIARRMRLMRGLAASAPGLPVPAVLDGDPAADPPFLVSAFVPGRDGGELLGSDEDARVLGRVAGEAARRIAAVPPRSLRTNLARRWSLERTLRRAAARWMSSLRPDALDAVRVAGIVERISRHLGEATVLAHGDLAPVNLVLDGERLVGLLDLERVRIAPVGFDAAWFRLMLRHHHPERWATAGPALLEAAGLNDGPGTLLRLDDLAVLACLEQAAASRGRPEVGAAWVARAREILAGELPGP
jgi:aminoglycoside phosphotransferase (APT) family kinase protein